MLEDLNDFSAPLIEDVRKRKGVARQQYLRKIVSPSNYRYLDRFSREVVDGGQSAANWGRGGAVVPDFSVGELMLSTSSEILAPVRCFHSGITGFLDLKYAQAGDFYAGSPAVFMADLHYSWTPPDGLLRISSGAALSPDVGDETIAVRRWVAFRVSLVVNRGGCASHFIGSIEDVAAMLEVAPEDVSVDAQWAIAGLMHEASVFPFGEGVPGFRAADSFYGGDQRGL
ncbi:MULTISPECIES: hypothetical protein [Streptomyces]|uniref:hypothetical protein n=1 Tax=Streptomyces TaxID=1883 RepID=UPI001590CE68|nr:MULTISPECIES: hypothetical protein [Streptomyces]QKV71507.1 hypothetical protein HUT13_24075 [Streptomyces harbinensis]